MSAILYKDKVYGGGSTFLINPILKKGIPLFDITVDGVTSTIYAPGEDDGTGGAKLSHYSNLSNDFSFVEINGNGTFSDYELLYDPTT